MLARLTRAAFISIVAVTFCHLSARAERLPVKTYTVADGLLRDGVRRIRQDSRGFLWFCTADGLSRFDGHGFTNFRAEDGLPDRHVNDILETRSGIYLIATDAGVAQLNPRGVRNSKENPLFTVYLPDNPKAKEFNVLFEDAAGQILAGTNDGLYRLKETDGKFDLENVQLVRPLGNFLLITAIIQDRRGILWIGTSGSGLIRRLPSGQIEHYTAVNGLQENGVAALREDAKGQIWAGLRGNPGGLIRLVDEPAPNRLIVARRYTAKDGLPGHWIPDLFQSSDGKFWVATIGGLCLWQGEGGSSVCKTYKAENGLCDVDVWSVTEDKDGNLWTGSQCGAKKIARYGFTTYGKADGLGLFVSSIFENPEGNLVVRTSDGSSIGIFDGAKFTSIKINFPRGVTHFGWGWRQLSWQDQAGAWWIPTAQGLYRFPNDTKFGDLTRRNPEKVKLQIPDEQIFRLYEDSRGDIWIATIYNSELLRWERATDTWHNYTREAGFSPSRIGSCFLEDRSGNLWIATGSDGDDSALIRYRNGHFKVFTKAEGAPPGWTRDLFLDHAGRLWLANTVLGLLRLDDLNADHLSFASYTTTDGLSSNGVYSVTEDAFGRIYAGTGRGLDRLNPETRQIENFTTADGLPNSDVQMAYRDRKNALWFATHSGLARFQPEPEGQRQPPSVFVTGLQVNGVARAISILGETSIPRFDLGSNQRQVNIDFLGLGATLGEKLRYEYRLTGTDWIQTNERAVNFANLAGGNYRFEIRAVSADRIYSQPAVVSFSIATPLWFRWWFLSLTALALALIAYSFYRYRVARLLELERVRTRIATDLHDEIGSNLSLIAMIGEAARRRATNDSQMARWLSTIAGTSRETVDAMSDIVWAVNPGKDRLIDLSQRMRRIAEEALSPGDVTLDFNAPGQADGIKVSADTRREVFMIFKECLNNIVRHSHCTAVEINLRVASGQLSLKVSDDGKGFDTDVASDGNGLANMRRRAEKLRGQLEVISSVAGGTTVRFSVPLDGQRRMFGR